MPVDDGIKLLVAALRAHGFTTDDSCEGHQSQRSNGPRVWITSGENEVLGRKLYDLDRESEESQSLSRTMQHNGYRVRASLLDLLDDFYDKRAVSEWVRIILEPRGIYGDCVLICQGTSTMDAIESDGQRLEWLKLAKQEFSDFTGFLVACFNPFSGDT
jgi:hypothetical protein